MHINSAKEPERPTMTTVHLGACFLINFLKDTKRYNMLKKQQHYWARQEFGTESKVDMSSFNNNKDNNKLLKVNSCI